MSGTTVSAIYTTDTTVFGPPVKELAAPNDSVWLNGGYLGIGVAAPTQLLEVYKVGNSGNSYFNGGIKVGGSTSTLGGFIGYNSSASGYFNITNLNDTGGANSRIQFGFGAAIDGTPATQVMTLNQSGSVGIGTATPSAKLEVNGSFAATTKSFLIDHPTKPGKKLRHGSLEGPENGVYIRGRGDNNIIELPEYWTELVDKDSITVQLTPIGKHQHIYVEKIENNTVYIQSDETRKMAQNFKFIDYYYLILAERKDVDKLVIEE
jgi:hypothetical protein